MLTVENMYKSYTLSIGISFLPFSFINTNESSFR